MNVKLEIIREIMEEDPAAIMLAVEHALNSDDKHVSSRLKAAMMPQRTVDFMPLIELNIDCTFESGSGHYYIDMLESEIDDKHGLRYLSKLGEGKFGKCWPRENFWFSFRQFGGIRVRPTIIDKLKEAGFKIEVDGNTFRFTGLRDGFKYGWAK